MTPRPQKRVTVNLGYNLTRNSGQDPWLRVDRLALVLLPANAAGLVLIPVANTYPANVTHGVPGPNPLGPLGPPGINWHKPSAAVAIDVTKTVTKQFLLRM